jgi:hypothetical protein
MALPTKMREKNDKKKAPVKKTTGKKSLTEAEKKAKAEAEAEHEKESEHESEHEAESEDDGGEDHDDEQKDKELIKKMIAEFLGDDAKGMSAEEIEAVHSLAHEAYQGHKEMGKEEKEAYQHAGEAIKLAHHMSKKEGKESEGDDEKVAGKKDAKAAPKKSDKADVNGHDHDDDGDEEESEANEAEHESESEKESEHEHKESAKVGTLRKQLLAAQGKIAALEADKSKSDVESYIDAELKKSGQPNLVTKRFKEAAGKIKNKADFDSKWKVFQEGLGQGRKDLDWGVLAEKSTASDFSESKQESNKLDFSACAED